MKKTGWICFGLGCLSALGFQPYSYLFLLVFTFSVLMAFLVQTTTQKQLFKIGFGFGFGLGACSLFWIVHALMIDAGAFLWATPLVPMGFGLLFGLIYGVSTLCCYQTKGVHRIFLFTAVFSLLEWVRSWILTGFPWNTLGNIWTSAPLVLQTASVVGVFGLGALSILWFSIPVFYLQKSRKTALILFLSFIFCIGIGGLRLMDGQEQKNVFGVNLRLVQANIPQSLKWDSSRAEESLFKHIRLSKTPGIRPTHVIWPEAATPYLLASDEGARALTLASVPQDGTLITGALRRMSPKQLANSVLIMNDMGELMGFYDKSHLVPFGEYVPLRGILPLQKVVPIALDFKPGSGPETVPIPNAPDASILVCYEVIFPRHVVAKPRPAWMINVTNDAWYGISAGPYQHLAMAQMRAVEEGLPLVRAANSGISAIIDPYGRIIRSLPLGTEGVLDGPLPRALKPTFYSLYGNTLLFFMIAGCFLLGFMRRAPNRCA